MGGQSVRKHGIEPNRTFWMRCTECVELSREPNLVGALASVGIEHGKTVRETADAYFAAEHAGHR